ncbi:MAG: sugar phosphate isomerase/epimerase [Candidatus Wolfebacteria bacterium]|nr:sugar phosphate isomerase/epimerase [Candidatus Wolfebacteria bacterium]
MNKSVNRIGVMQGRLLPKHKGRYQAHPAEYWQDEFLIAKELGLGSIEFLFDYENFQNNPLMTDEGLKEIIELSDKTGVLVKNICADYFMEAPIHNVTDGDIKQNLEVLKKLIANASKMGVSNIVFPCLEKTAILGSEDIKQFSENVKLIIDFLEKSEVNLSLETDLAPEPFTQLLNNFNSRRVTVNYDTGNSAFLGYDPQKEFVAYGNKISNIHIKDRKIGSGSVELGTGDTQFDKIFTGLSKIGYSGFFTIQAYRDDEGIEIFKRQLEWIKNKFNEFGINLYEN